MTDEELKAVVAQNSLAIQELLAGRLESERWWQESEQRWQELRQESAQQRQESDQRWQELRQDSERWWQESSQESAQLRQDSERWWQESRQDSDQRRQESERWWQESRQESAQWWQESRQESQRLWEEILASRKESDRLITSFNRQLGQLGNKFGDYTEALFRPSLEQALREQFGMTEVISRLRIRRNDEIFEFDMVAHAGDESDKVYLVEIKSHLREDGIIQLLDQLRQFPRLFPEHRGKKLFGILAALDIPEEIRLRAQREGLYLATIKDDVFEIGPPGDGFEPRAFGLRGLG